MNDEKRDRRDDSRQDKGSQERPLREHQEPGRRQYSEDPAKWDTTVQNTDHTPDPPTKNK